MKKILDKAFKKLTFNYGEGLYNLSFWLPLFASSWLVHGFIVKKIDTFSYFFIPLVIFFILINSKQQNEISLAKKKQTIVFILIFFILYTLYLQHSLEKLELTISFFIVVLCFIADWLLSPMQINSILKVVIKSILPLIIVSCFVIIGIFSQYEERFSLKALSYLVLGIIPGLTLMSRTCLMHSKVLENKGWKYEQLVKTKKGEIKRPGGISRLVIGTMILGPAIPSILMPFNVIPQSMFIVSLSFLMVPKLAQKIQSKQGSHEERVIYLTFFASIVSVLSFIGARFA